MVVAATSLIQERRKSPRTEPSPRLAIHLMRPQGAVATDGVNLSEGGVCCRLEEVLEVRSLVRLQVAPQGGGATARRRWSVECTGRVVWVIQRLDLRTHPPFVYDVGIEFVDLPPLLQQWLAHRRGGEVGERGRPPVRSSKQLEPALIRGRQFVPRLERDAVLPTRWHLVVSVDGAPCFSGRYPLERAALAAWVTFKRQQGRR